jgi:hypothetical protein
MNLSNITHFLVSTESVAATRWYSKPPSSSMHLMLRFTGNAKRSGVSKVYRMSYFRSPAIKLALLIR